MPSLAVTGGIAAGKSTFTRLFQALTGAAAFDADACTRRLMAGDHDTRVAVRAEFGPGVFDPASGAVDRDALRAVVFADPARRRALEAILHPRARAAWQGWLKTGLQSAPDALMVVEIPLLYETGAAGFFDAVIAVGCSEAGQIRRLTRERGLSEAMARQIITSQWPLPQKISLCDHLIWNEGSAERLQGQAALCAGVYQSRS